VANTARLDLVLTQIASRDGDSHIQSDILQEGVLASGRSVSKPEMTTITLLEKFRLGLWRSGYFQDMEIIERRNLTATVPLISEGIRPRENTLSGSSGYGTDTQLRFSFFGASPDKPERGCFTSVWPAAAKRQNIPCSKLPASNQPPQQFLSTNGYQIGKAKRLYREGWRPGRP
jgi:hypothetical protein